jgi:hypothetical protein
VIGVLERLHVLIGALNALNLVEDLLETLKLIVLYLILEFMQLFLGINEGAN